MMTKRQRLVLKALSRTPSATTWGVECSAGIDAAGLTLAGLERKGLVRKWVAGTNRLTWQITPAGREALAAEENRS